MAHGRTRSVSGSTATLTSTGGSRSMTWTCSLERQPAQDGCAGTSCTPNPTQASLLRTARKQFMHCMHKELRLLHPRVRGQWHQVHTRRRVSLHSPGLQRLGVVVHDRQPHPVLRNSSRLSPHRVALRSTWRSGLWPLKPRPAPRCPRPRAPRRALLVVHSAVRRSGTQRYLRLFAGTHSPHHRWRHRPPHPRWRHIPPHLRCLHTGLHALPPSAQD